MELNDWEDYHIIYHKQLKEKWWKKHTLYKKTQIIKKKNKFIFKWICAYDYYDSGDSDKTDGDVRTRLMIHV